MKKRRLFIVSFCATLLFLAILVAIPRPNHQMLYRVTYLPSLGKEFFLPCSINDKGQIAGHSIVAYRSYHLFLWDREKGLQDLGPQFDNEVYINNTGQIAAIMKDPNDHLIPSTTTLYNVSGLSLALSRAFIWDPNHGRRLLPTLGGKTAIAHGINNHGQVVGTAETASGVLHACVWNANSEIHDLTPSSKRHTQAWSINDTGQVVISARRSLLLVDANEIVTSTYTTIPVLGLLEINNNGYVAGMVQAGPGKYDIVIWHPDLGQKKLVQSYTNSLSETKINDVNQVLLIKGRQPKVRIFGRTLFSTHVQNYLHDP
ncbi:MAG: hypothetical protein JRF71_16730, partial [Deltaproteobacteria bacterium]|nr:hypothetical protein [Deltaproteobacteria bacterium]